MEQLYQKKTRSIGAERRKARRFALQALYQWQIEKSPPRLIAQQFQENNDFQKTDLSYFKLLLSGVSTHVAALDAKIAPLLDRKLIRLDPVELTVLRMGCFELLKQKEVPYRVVINESIELVKRFGAQDAHRYVNGILDKLALIIRAEEIRTAS